jgi:hypothetical protein
MKVLQGFDNVIPGPKDMWYITEKSPSILPNSECVNHIIAWPCTLVLPKKNFPVINQHYFKESINCMLV